MHGPAPVRWALAGALAGLGCGGGGGGGGGGGEDETAAGSTGTGTGGSVDESAPSDVCEEAPRVEQGRFSGSLRGDEERSGGVCGSGGPDRFLRVTVPARADVRVEVRGNGFAPRVGLSTGDCAGAALACSADGIARLADVQAGTELLLTIGADAAVYAAIAAEEPPADEPDPLGFAVDIGLNPVLAAGEVCVPQVLGRCAAGTLCAPSPAADEDPWRCTALDGDSCADPQRVQLALTDGAGTLTVDPDRPQSDAHRHSCTGGGTRERVLRVRLPGGLGPLDSLEIRSERAEVGLAVRAPGCLGSDELDCGAPQPGGARVTIAEPAALQAAGVEPYLFVELPEPGVLEALVTLQVRVVLHAPPFERP